MQIRRWNLLKCLRLFFCGTVKNDALYSKKCHTATFALSYDIYEGLIQMAMLEFESVQLDRQTWYNQQFKIK